MQEWIAMLVVAGSAVYLLRRMFGARGDAPPPVVVGKRLARGLRSAQSRDHG